MVAAAELSHSAIAVGSAGTVVAWSYGKDDNEQFVETSTAGDVELRGVTDAGGGRWVVVGDGGFASVSDNYGQTWTTLDLQTSADLRAVVTFRESVVVVGDEVVRVLQGGTWLEPPTPEGGWGQLRGIGASELSDDYPRIFAVGRAGVIWSSDDPSGAWVPEDSGVSVDLFAVGPLLELVGTVGANGTLLLRDAGEWIPIESERTVDFVDLVDDQHFSGSGLLLAADGEILQYHRNGRFQHLDRIEGARDLAVALSVVDGGIFQPIDALIAVGNAGMAVSKDFALWCE